MSALFWTHLRKKLEREIEHADAIVGVCVLDLVDGNTVAINADEVFPTASTIKIHVLATLFLLAEEGALDLSQRIRFEPGQGAGGSGVLEHLEDGVDLTLLDVAVLMIALSDNTATNVCIDSVGLGRVNDLIQSLGLSATRLGRKMMDGEAMRIERENISTPSDMVKLLTDLHYGRPTRLVSERTLALLKKPKQSFIGQVVPAGLAIANKPGWIDGVRSDAGIVYLPRRPYAVSIMVKYGNGTAIAQDALILRIAEFIHTRMSVLDESNPHGHRVFQG